MAAVTNIRARVAAVDVLAPGAADPRASWNCQVCGILLEVARRFCACKQKSDGPSKCAKKMGGRYEGESGQDDRHAGIGIGSVETASSPIDYRQLIEDTE